MARSGPRLAPLLPLLVMLAGAPASRGQDLEPSLRRAASAMAAEVTRDLPRRAPEVRGLVVVPGRGAGATALGAVARALLDAGFDVAVGRRAAGHPGALVLRLGAERARDGSGYLSLEAAGATEPWRIVRRFGDAAWVDDPGDDEIVVTGPFRKDAEEARLAARRLAWQRVVARLEIPDEDAPSSALLDRLPVRTFVAEAEADDATAVHRVWYGVHLGATEAGVVRGAARELRSARRRAPWIRLGIGAGIGVMLLLAYLRTDLATRGYLTGRLRLGFGMLFFVGLVVCWRAPL